MTDGKQAGGTAGTANGTTAGRVAANLRVLMALAGIDQRRLAARIGWSEPAVSRKLSGRRQWTADDLDTVAAGLGVAVWLLVADAATFHAGLTARQKRQLAAMRQITTVRG